MADVKVLYIDSDGYQAEASPTADSVQLLSFKTANYELTDTHLGNLIGGGDGSSEHTHDSVYFRESEFIDTSAGAGDAGKPVKTDSGGYLNSLLDLTSLNGDLDHGSLLGLSDDDHTIYLKADGTRNLSGIQSYASHPSFTSDTQLIDKKYVDDLHIGNEWYPYSALSYIADNTAIPPSENLNDVYVLSASGGTPNAAWDGASAGDIVKFDGTNWVATTPTVGTKISIDDEADGVRLWSGSSWVRKYYEATTASTGLIKVGVDIQLDDAVAASGIQISSGVISAVVDGSSIGINGSEQISVKANGINDTHIDWGTGTNQVSAVDIPIADVGSFTSQTEVEGALQELYGMVAQAGIQYIAGTGGVSKGVPLYVSANDTVLGFSSLSNASRVIGIAAEDAVETALVKSVANDTVIPGILTSATAGVTYYWNGTALTTIIPTGAGSHVWKMGVAKNATDLHVEVEFIKKNA